MPKIEIDISCSLSTSSVPSSDSPILRVFLTRCKRTLRIPFPPDRKISRTITLQYDKDENPSRVIFQLFRLYDTLENSRKYTFFGQWGCSISELNTASAQFCYSAADFTGQDFTPAKLNITGVSIRYSNWEEYSHEREKGIVEKHGVWIQKFRENVLSQNPHTPWVRRFHLPKYDLPAEYTLGGKKHTLSLVAPAFMLQKPREPIPPEVVRGLLKIPLLKVNWTEEHFIKKANILLGGRREGSTHKVLAVLGYLLTSMIYDYGADLDIERSRDVEEFKIVRDFFLSGDCEDGAEDMYVFATQLRAMPPSGDPLVDAIIGIMQLYHPVMVTGSASAGSRIATMKKTGDPKHPYLSEETNTCHVWSMLLSDDWMRGKSGGLPPLILEGTGIVYPIPKPLPEDVEYWKKYKAHSPTIIIPPEEGDVYFYNFMNHVWCETFQPYPGSIVLDWILKYSDGYGVEFTDVIEGKTEGIKLKVCQSFTPQDVEDMRWILENNLHIMPQWTGVSHSGDLGGRMGDEDTMKNVPYIILESKQPFPEQKVVQRLYNKDDPENTHVERYFGIKFL